MSRFDDGSPAVDEKQGARPTLWNGGLLEDGPLKGIHDDSSRDEPVGTRAWLDPDEEGSPSSCTQRAGEWAPEISRREENMDRRRNKEENKDGEDREEPNWRLRRETVIERTRLAAWEGLLVVPLLASVIETHLAFRLGISERTLELSRAPPSKDIGSMQSSKELDRGQRRAARAPSLLGFFEAKAGLQSRNRQSLEEKGSLEMAQVPRRLHNTASSGRRRRRDRRNQRSDAAGVRRRPLKEGGRRVRGADWTGADWTGETGETGEIGESGSGRIVDETRGMPPRVDRGDRGRDARTRNRRRGAESSRRLVRRAEVAPGRDCSVEAPDTRRPG